MTDENAISAANPETRGIALEAVLSHAAISGLEKALEQFGEPLTPTERELVKTLTPQEITSLAMVNAKLPGQSLKANNNNNNNNKQPA